MQHMTMAISGMSCGGCVSRVRKALEGVSGTRVEAVTVGSATVAFDASRTTPGALAEAVRAAGYETVAAGARVAAGGGCCSAAGSA